MVRIHPDPPGSASSKIAGPPRPGFVPGVRGCSSIGRAPALQAGGRRFDPVQLHQTRGPAVSRMQAGRGWIMVWSVAMCVALNGAFWFPQGEQRVALRAAVFFNNGEGKGSHDLMRVV